MYILYTYIYIYCNIKLFTYLHRFVTSSRCSRSCASFSCRFSAVTPTEPRARDTEVVGTEAMPSSRWSVPTPPRCPPGCPARCPMERAKLKATSKPQHINPILLLNLGSHECIVFLCSLPIT